MIRISVVCKHDLFGQGFQIAQALDRDSRYEARQFSLHESRFKFKTNLVTPENLHQARKFIHSSDVIIFREYPDLVDSYRLDLSKLKEKIIIASFGGLGIRFKHMKIQNLEFYESHFKDLTFATTSLDFTIPFKDWLYIPHCLDFKAMKRFAIRRSNLVTFIHSPTLPNFQTLRERNAFRYISEQLKNRAQFRFITNTINKKLLELKASSDVIFDRFSNFSEWYIPVLIYGTNSIEGAALKQAVLTCCYAGIKKKIEKLFDIKCPFIHVDDREDLLKESEKLIEDRDLLIESQEKCYQYAVQLHDGTKSVSQISSVVK